MGEPSEGHVARLILHHVGVHRRRQAVLGEVADPLEGRQRQPLDENLHPEVRHVPPPIGEHRLEQRLQTGRDRIGDTELVVQQTRVGLDVARLVHHVCGRVELGIEVRRHLHDAGGGHERPLLTVHELRERLRLLVVSQVHALLVRELLPDRRAEDRDQPVVDLLRILRIEILRPVDAHGGVPLLLLALVVEAEQPLALVLVLPGERRLRLAGQRPAGLLHGQLIPIHGRHGESLLGRDSRPAAVAAHRSACRADDQSVRAPTL